MTRMSHNREVVMKRLFCACMLILILASPPAWSVSVLGGLTHQMTLAPGERKEGTIQLYNRDDVAARVRVSQTDYAFFADGRTLYDEAGSSNRSNAGWIDVSPLNVTIPPKETVSIFYEITAPNDPGIAGTYWSIIMVEPIAETGSGVKGQDGKVVLGLQTVIRYAVQIISDIGETGSSTISITNNKVVVLDGKTVLQTDVANVGERWLSPAVWTEFYDKDGRYVGRFDSNRQRVLPSCSVRHAFDLTSVPKGTYTALFVVDNGDDRVFGTTYEVRLQP
jgi:hypothetical protein